MAINTQTPKFFFLQCSDSTLEELFLEDLEKEFSTIGIRRRRRAYCRRSFFWMHIIKIISSFRRLCDATLALVLICLLSPVLVGCYFIAIFQGGGIEKQQKLGRAAIHFDQYKFRFSKITKSIFGKLPQTLPTLFNILVGQMSFIGPRATSPMESFTQKEHIAWKRYNLRPGILSLSWLRKRANIGYICEAGLDMEYVETNSLSGDIGIAFRALLVAFLGGDTNNDVTVLSFLGIRVDNLTMLEASSRIVEMAQAENATQVCFVNTDCFNLASHDLNYRSTISSSALVLADGIGVRLAGALLNQSVRENINGTDMLPFLCAAAEQARISIYLLGGRPGVPERTAAWINKHYPKLRIAGTHHGYFTELERSDVCRQINASTAQILLVAFGAPHQDLWIANYGHETGAKVSIGVGGLFDFYSGRIPRAPVWMRELGMEWLYRFWQEPRRMWRRYFLGNMIFLYRVVFERFHPRHSPKTGRLSS